MSEELRPCFFCEHDEARVIVVDEVTDAGAEEATVPLYAASCPYCGARGPMALSEDEAVEAWNRRAERTCRMTFDDVSSSLYSGPMLKCSKCGACVPREFSGPYNYCPSCGARVVGE